MNQPCGALRMQSVQGMKGVVRYWRLGFTAERVLSRCMQKYGNSALYWAVYHRNMDVAIALLDHGADINAFHVGVYKQEYLVMHYSLYTATDRALMLALGR